MKKPHLLIDGDIDAYKACEATADTLDFDDGLGVTKVYHMEKAQQYVAERLEGYQARLKSDHMTVCLSCAGPTFRHSIDQTYKGNRDPALKPPILDDLKSWIEETYVTKRKPLLEADDVMGITSTLYPGQCIIVSNDKDMRTIPGRLYIPNLDTVITVSDRDADFYHMYQTLTGDTTDNYKGCPGIGPAKAEQYLNEADIPCVADWWFVVVTAYQCKGYTEEQALVQARLARILRVSDYTFNTGEPILWTP